MGAQLRVYRKRIKSVTSTKKITKAMEMIAASRVVKAQRLAADAAPYAEEISRAVAAVPGRSGVRHPLTGAVLDEGQASVLVITSDRGLAGGYCVNALKAADRLVEELRATHQSVDCYVVGRKGVSYYTFCGCPPQNSWTGLSDRPSFLDARMIAEEVGTGRELHIVYTEFLSMMTQRPVTEQLLPLGEAEEIEGPRTVIDFEPSAVDVLDALLPRYVESRIYSALLQSAASEHAARRRAMKSATDNAGDLINSLSRLANAARQAEITQEISEIVGGSAALADTSAGSDK